MRKQKLIVSYIQYQSKVWTHFLTQVNGKKFLTGTVYSDMSDGVIHSYRFSDSIRLENRSGG